MGIPVPNSGGGELRVDYDGLGAIMRSSGVQELLNEKAARMMTALAGAADGRVWVNRYSTDRAVVSITIGIQGGVENADLKYGVLSDAAAAAGLEIKFTGGG